MRIMHALIAVLVLAVASPAVAQTTSEPSERMRALARDYVDQLNLERLIQELYQGAVDAEPEWRRLQRELFGTGKGESPTVPMPTFVPEMDMEALRPFIEIIESVLVETHARTYSEDQLEAMIRFHASRDGREILASRDDFVINLLTVMLEMTPALLEQLGLPEDDEMLLEEGASSNSPTRSMQPTFPNAAGRSLGDILSEPVIAATDATTE